MTSRDLNLNRGVAPLPKVGFQKFFDLRDRESPICKRPLAPKYRPSTFMTVMTLGGWDLARSRVFRKRVISAPSKPLKLKLAGHGGPGGRVAGGPHPSPLRGLTPLRGLIFG